MDHDRTEGGAGEPVDERTERLRLLVAECLDRIETEGLAALEDLCERHPGEAEALRRRVSALRGIGLIGEPPGPGAAGAGEGREFPERLGEFRLLRPLGGGGMGVVYLAEQEGLNRTVALKLIRPEHLYFPGARDRFRREVDAVARLRHPGIVPVYTSGEENGIPYFTMEHVEGRSLAEVMKDLVGAPLESLDAEDLARAVGEDDRERPTGSGSSTRSSVLRGRWVDACFRIAREVAAALQHAHERGVLHRDVKPSNVMLTPEGRVMLLDFGLAVSEGASKLTRSGARIGSLPYMAPEQVLGRLAEIGPPTDVYGLGATLYELLTLALPHPGDSVDEVEQAIVDGRPIPPSRHNPQIAWDAETVCLTALDPDPRRRYPTADAFARDLTNVLERRPIEARRPGVGLRGRRFVQRHPAIAVGAALGAAIVVGGPLVFGLMQRARAREVTGLNEQLEVALAEARARKAEADRGFGQALGAVDLMLSEVARKELDQVPLMETVRRRLLERALEFYRGFLVERGDDLEVRRRTAQAWLHVGRIQHDLGDRDEAAKCLGEAVQQLDDLAAASRGPADEVVAIQARVEFASFLLEAGDVEAAEECVAPLAPATAPSVAAAGSSADVARALALSEALQVRGRIAQMTDRPEVAEERLREVARIQRAAAAMGHPGAGELAANTLGELALMLMRRPDSYPDRVNDIDRLQREALELAAPIPGEPADVRSRLLRASLLQNQGSYEQRLGRLEEAEATLRSVVPEFESLVAEYPAMVSTRQELAHVRNNLGLTLELTGRYDEAEDLYRQGIDGLEALDRAVPGVPKTISNIGVGWMNLASVAKARGDRQAEASRLEVASGWLERASRANPLDLDLRMPWFNALAALCQARLALGDHRAAAVAGEAAPDALPESWLHSVKGAIYLANCARVAAADPDLPEDEAARARLDYARRGTALLRRAVDLGFTNHRDLPTHDDFAPFHGVAEFEDLLADLGLPPSG